MHVGEIFITLLLLKWHTVEFSSQKSINFAIMQSFLYLDIGDLAY